MKQTKYSEMGVKLLTGRKIDNFIAEKMSVKQIKWFFLTENNQSLYLEHNYLLRLNINPWKDIVNLFSPSIPLIVEHGYHFMPLDSANLQKRM